MFLQVGTVQMLTEGMLVSRDSWGFLRKEVGKTGSSKAFPSTLGPKVLA